MIQSSLRFALKKFSGKSETTVLDSPAFRILQYTYKTMRRDFFIQNLFVPSVFVIIGCGSVVREYFYRLLRENEPLSFAQAIFDQLPYWLAWAFLSVLIQKLALRYRLERPHLRRDLTAHFAASVICATLITILNLLISPLNDPSFQTKTYTSIFLFLLIPVVVIYWATLGIYLAIYYQQQLQAEALRTARLNEQLVEARLTALQMQLQPHFLFNTLHSITALILKEENRSAVKMINLLSDFLRFSLKRFDAPIVALKNELEFTEMYLEIERVRFQDRLTIQMDIDPQTLDTRVPQMILQPLVENAVRHGIANRTQNCRIEIRTRLADGKICLEVCDNGEGLAIESDSEKNGAGLGLKNTRERLSQLYGANYDFELFTDENNLTTAKIVLPFNGLR